jgi:OmcA/MtrC family decaheme c-type cytochrome
MRRWQTIFLILLMLSGMASVHAQSPLGGLKAEITAVMIAANRPPVVTFNVRDVRGKPIDLEDLDPNSVKFTIAAQKVGKSGESDYQNYILTKVIGREYVYKGETRKPALAETLQPDYDQGGVLARVRPGVLAYTFKTALPANFDQRATHVVGGEMSMGNRRYVANPVYYFVPAGGKVQTNGSVIETATCNNCHDPLRAHGGARVETAYCALCHTSQLSDPETGENLDFRYFVHKIHRGKYPQRERGKVVFYRRRKPEDF